jgi:hypothetical protein
MQADESEARSFITVGWKEEHERMAEVARRVKMQKRRRINGIEHTTTPSMNGYDTTEHDETASSEQLLLTNGEPPPSVGNNKNSNGDPATPVANKKGKGMKLFDKLKRGGKDSDSDMFKDESVSPGLGNTGTAKGDIAELTKMLRCLKSLDGM